MAHANNKHTGTNSTLQLNDLTGSAWAMGPTITSQDGPVLIKLDTGAYNQRDNVYFGFVELDEGRNAAARPGLDDGDDLLPRNA